jgi:acetyl-CoA C-acetyltransferase
MSRAPFVMAKADAAYSRDFTVFDSTIGARFPNPRIVSEFGNDSMPQTGDNVAQEYGIDRTQADVFAARSQANYHAARQRGFFNDELLGVSVPTGRKTPPNLVEQDEHPRPQSDLAALTRLRPLQEGGVVTAGNASGVNDGAAALLIGTAAAGERHGLVPMARILSSAAAGVAPRIMGVGPVEAINKALARAVLGCLKGLGLALDDPRVNPNGGAIAVGHPLGASGARLALSTARALQESGKRFAVVSLCIGVGQGLAMVIERA